MTNQPKRHIDKKPGYETKSGTTDPDNKKTDLAMFTDNGQGFHYSKENGMKLDLCFGTSYELCGADITTDGIPGKVIRAENGNINIEAMNGEVVIKAKSIRLVAQDGSGEITLVSAKQVAINSPIQNFKGTVSNTVMTSTADTAALAAGVRGEIQQTSSSGDADNEGSILTQLLRISEKFRAWISACVS